MILGLINLVDKFPNLKVFKFWSLKCNAKTQKYIELAREKCKMLTELHFGDYVWKDVLGETP